MIEYIGKSLLINKKVLVIGDLHLGFGESMRAGGVFVPVDVFEEIMKDIKEIFERVDNVEKVIILGDLKHEFGRVLMDERKEIGELMNYLRRKAGEVVVVRGNHDAIVEGILTDLDNVRLEEYYLWNEYGFLHGDKDYLEIHNGGVKVWVIGHAHPAITLEEKNGIKKEKYKCYLEGNYKGRKIIVMPSFVSVNEGSDPRDYDLRLAWDFRLNGFEVKIVGENLDVLNFGKLGKL
jgi:uncharacterized protein